MSLPHRTLIRTAFGNRGPLHCGYRFEWHGEQGQQAWFTDEAGAPRVREVAAERGGRLSCERRSSLQIDLGGCIFGEKDRVCSVLAGGYRFSMWSHQRADILGLLEQIKPALDAPTLMVIPSRWWRLFVSVETAAALRGALREDQRSAVREQAQRDQHMAGFVEGVNSKLAAQGSGARIMA